jgi:hypothetical protein
MSVSTFRSSRRLHVHLHKCRFGSPILETLLILHVAGVCSPIGGSRPEDDFDRCMTACSVVWIRITQTRKFKPSVVF